MTWAEGSLRWPLRRRRRPVRMVGYADFIFFETPVACADSVLVFWRRFAMRCCLCGGKFGKRAGESCGFCGGRLLGPPRFY